MAVRNRFQYETSPRKLEPNMPKKQPQKKKLKVVEDLPKQEDRKSVV